MYCGNQTRLTGGQLIQYLQAETELQDTFYSGQVCVADSCYLTKRWSFSAHLLIMLRTSIPVLRVTSAKAATSFYCDRLGFEIQFAYRLDESRDDPCYMGLVRDDIRLHVSSFPGDGVPGSVVYIIVDDVDAVYARLLETGVPVDLEPTDQTWGNRETYVKDPDGNTLRFVRENG